MRRRFALTLLLALSLTLMAAPSLMASAQTANALVRLVHAIPDAPAADILIDGTLAAPALGYAEYTHYFRVSGGSHTVAVQVAGVSVAEGSFIVGEGQAFTVIALGTADAPEVMSFEDDLNPLVLGNSRLNAIHAASDADTVDVVFSDGSPALPALAYGTSSGSIDIPANVYPMAVTPGGGSVDQALVPATEYALRGGMSYRLVVLGGQAGALLLESPALPEADAVGVRVVHAIPGAPAVDVYANETLLIPNLTDGEATQHIALPLDAYNLSLRTAGAASTAAPLATLSLDLSDTGLAGQARAVVAVNQGGALGLAVFEDNVADLAAGNARIGVFNAVAGTSISVMLDDGNAAATDLTFESASSTTDMAAGMHTFSVTTDGGGEATAPAQTLNGGVLYQVIVAGTPEQPTLIVAETALNQQPGSAAVVVAEAPPAAATEEAVPQATEETEVVQAPPPTQAPPPAPATPVEGPIALVNLNPGVNLQLREYPSPEARSMGLAPSGTILVVLGRAGEPGFVGFVELPEEEDLDPAATWLSVIYNTPDGGTITAWVLAEHLEVSEDGEDVRLVDLEPLPSDAPGEAVNTAVTSPPLPVTEFYGQIINLDPGVNLHIRRTPGPDGESLIRLPVGTPVEVVGILADYSWTLIRYSPPEGGSVTGWAFTQYVKFIYNGEEYFPTVDDINELFLLGAPLNFADGTELGEIGSGTSVQPPAAAQSPAAQPQPQPQAVPQADFTDQIVATTLLDPGVNLHLRRTPGSDGESLALIPDATTMVVSGRTADNNWLRVTYDGIDGWIASAYVELRLNGRRVEIFDVPEVTP